MASTYSQNLKIELIGSGNQVGAWGTTTNNNLGTTIEEAIVGYGAVQFTNDANLTLTLSNSNASQLARNFFLYMTSTVTLSTQRDLIVPTIEKTYTVHNNTSGGQAVRVKTVAGTGIVVPSGKKMILYVDGTNVIEQVDYVTSLAVGTLNISNVLPVASGGTGASTASGARTNLGLGSIARQNSNSVTITGGSITGITDLAVADGGTGASTAANARTNLGAAASGANSDITSLSGLTTPLSVSQGGTGATASTGSGSVVLASSPTISSPTISSPSLTGTPTAPTQSTSDSSTRVATTAFVKAALQTLYPVGSVYINASSTTNPSSLLGFGTWAEIGAGRVLVGQDTGDASFNSMGETGGTKDAIVVSHTHTGTTASSGSHTHSVPYNGLGISCGGTGALASGVGSVCFVGYDDIPSAGTHTHTFTTDSTGSSGTNANLQPYIVVKMWQRTA